MLCCDNSWVSTPPRVTSAFLYPSDPLGTMRQQILTDGHAPAEYRAATVRNFDAWYKAFDVQAGQKLYLPPEQRVKVW